ncbi:MAG: RagB/SusD family nutrient uptake outer membrane protein [Prevotella sp.]|nr:RagB/SusD family nutrient uptake outer membrane protein [Prevotella sp.]
MKKILSIIAVAATLTTTSCIKEIEPQSSTITVDQVKSAPGAFNNAVAAITATLCGEFVYGGGDNNYPYDLGIPAFYLERDIMGQDVVYVYQNWYTYWYTVQYLGPSYRMSQMPWTYYYGWIKSCNEVLSMAGEEPAEDQKAGAGIAYAMRAYFYMDLARMYAQKPYALAKTGEQSVSVPIVNENTSLQDLAHNPRATNEDMWAFILSDLDKAETLLADYKRTDVYTPDQSVVYGLKARAYLEMEDWANAEKYAKMAQNGYTIMTQAEYTDWNTGFNTPNGAWMFGMTYKTDDPQILNNDADSSWGSMMCIEINPTVSGCGYAANYGQPFIIDRHLYETIPATDCRKKCYVDFAIDDNIEIADGDGNPTPEGLEALSAYSNHPDWLINTGLAARGYGKVGGLPLKFRTAGGEAGRDNQYIGFVVAVPIMRVEEMYLIEAEAAGMQNEARGIELLTKFAKTRDADYVYGTHNEAYYNTTTSKFQNECWWQRRVEFWGEGMATFDIKRLQKGIIRSYAGSNHTDGYRYNSETTPEWMNWCIVQTETNYNYDCTNNKDPQYPGKNSEEYVW